MNPASAPHVGTVRQLEDHSKLLYFGIPVDLVRAIATFFLWLGAEPMLEKLDRIKYLRLS